MSHGLKFIGRFGPNPLGRRIGGDPLWVPGFQVFQFPKQTVVLGIGDLRVVQDIITVVVIVKLRAEFLDSFV
jgi:hypothetical protein